MVRAPQQGLLASYTLQFVALLERWGVTAPELFADLPIRREDLDDPAFIVPAPVSRALIERARALSGEPALGFYFGLQMSLAAHGYMSLATMSAPTLGDAIALAIRYAPTRTTALAFRLVASGASAALVVDELVDYGSARDVVLLGLLVGSWHMAHTAIGQHTPESTIEIALSEPQWYARFRDVEPRIRFGAAENRWLFPASLLDARLHSADAGALELAKEHCERLLTAATAQASLAARARRLVVRADAGILSFEQLAAALRISPRTLRRKLALEDTSYAALVDEARQQRAVLLVGASKHSIKTIAERLGYAKVSNFARAFRRWTGQTPAAYRGDRAHPEASPAGPLAGDDNAMVKR